MESENVKHEDNQETHAPNGWGGRRPNAGRKIGIRDRLKVTDFFNAEERDQLVMEAKLLAFGDGNSKPDKDMIKFLFEQLFGKATQKQELTGEDGQPLVLALAESILNKYASQSETKRDSSEPETV